jgi:hypothetical protein
VIELSDKKSLVNNVETIFDKVNLTPETYSNACVNADRNAILIEYIPSPKSFWDYIKGMAKGNIVTQSLFFNLVSMNILYQVYSVLSAISTEYTHYDLHTDNVIIYGIKDKGYMNMVYHYPDGSEVVLKTLHIAKIIDYGRNHCPITKTYFNQICKDKKNCTSHIAPNNYMPDCGADSGHSHFAQFFDKQEFFISMLNANPSHDLRLGYILYSYGIKMFDTKAIWPQTLDLLSNIVYKTSYGTPPAKSLKSPFIYNVVDMANELKTFINSTIYQDQMTLLVTRNGLKSVGTMHIYIDRSKPLEFISE